MNARIFQDLYYFFHISQFCISFLCSLFFFSFFLFWAPTYFYSIFFFFLRSHLWHMEVSRLGVEMELQPTATVTQDLSRAFCLPYSPQQQRILNPISKARDRTCIFMDTSWVCNLMNHNRNSLYCVLSSELPFNNFYLLLI